METIEISTDEEVVNPSQMQKEVRNFQSNRRNDEYKGTRF